MRPYALDRLMGYPARHPHRHNELMTPTYFVCESDIEHLIDPQVRVEDAATESDPNDRHPPRFEDDPALSTFVGLDSEHPERDDLGVLVESSAIF